tara:strand:- start:28 stop:219 length:192 start_codon:yes stop_codon:yes gene_type:complete
MAQYISDIIEDDTVTCDECNKTFNTQEITVDDWLFEWDNIVTQDCCSNCANKFYIGSVYNDYR